MFYLQFLILQQKNYNYLLIITKTTIIKMTIETRKQTLKFLPYNFRQTFINIVIDKLPIVKVFSDVVVNIN